MPMLPGIIMPIDATWRSFSKLIAPRSEGFLI
jgi:hypothetical protein